MANAAAHLVDRVLPAVPVRKGVLSLPFELRQLAAFRADGSSRVISRCGARNRAASARRTEPIPSVVSPSKSFDVKMSKALVSSVGGSRKGEAGSSRSDGRSRV
jgi:hypothetical protein